MIKERYMSPRVTFTDVEQEGLLCNSIRLNLHMQELENMNAVEDSDEEFYFKS